MFLDLVLVLVDFIEIDIEVEALAFGNIVATGTLVGPAGDVIGSASGLVNLQQGETGVVVLSFATDRCFGGLTDGNYQLVDLVAYHTGIPEDSLFMELAHTSNAYPFMDFERWGDADNDGDIDDDDTTAFLAAFGSVLGDPNFDPGFDWDLDFEIDFDADFDRYNACFAAVNP